MHPSPQRDERGSMLIVALGILALLSVMAITFVTLMNLERTATKNYVDGVKSRLIAEGGMELSIEQLKRSVSIRPYSTLEDPWIYAQGHFYKPLAEATAERFSPGAVPAGRYPASFAGRLGASYSGGMDQYKIKVIDTQTQFNLNSVLDMRVDPLDSNLTLDFGYVRFLDVLGAAIARRTRQGTSGVGRDPVQSARWIDPVAGEVRGGRAIYLFRASRESERFKSKSELLEILQTEDDFILLKDYVTANSWTDRKSVKPRGPQSQSQDSLDSRPWSDVQLTGREEARSPININLATPEILTANLAGIAGRALYVWTDFDEAQDAQGVDAGHTNPDVSMTGANDPKEELRYGAKGIVVYIPPFGYKPGDNPGDPPDFVGARLLAELISQRRENGQYFSSFSDWERWVDETLTDSYLQSTPHPDRPGERAFPNHGSAQLTELDGPPLATPSPQTVIGEPRFRRWFYEAVRSMIKANMNPNPRLSSFNPDAVVYMPVDKGGLLYRNPGALDPNDPVAYLHPRQTFEWCFAPKGVFEITALGEVLGPVPTDPARRQDLDGDGEWDNELFAQSKMRAIIQLYDTETVRTQRDFEFRGNVYRGADGGDEAISYPVPKVYWDPSVPGLANMDVDAFYTRWDQLGLTPSDKAGYVQLSTARQYSDFDDRVVRTAVTFMENEGDTPLFEALFQNRRVADPSDAVVLNADALFADTAAGRPTRYALPSTDPIYDQATGGRPDGPNQPGGPNKWAWPYGNARDAIWPTTSYSKPGDPHESWRWEVLTPDGYLNSILRPSLLWYRASDAFESLDGSVVQFPPNRQLPRPGFHGVSNAPGADYDFDARRRGNSNHDFDLAGSDGNLAPAPRGGVEFWFKPDFDWSIPGSGPDRRLCGFLGTSHVLRNELAFRSADAGEEPGVWSRGTQMFVTRNTAGEVRVTRLYFEAVGPEGSAAEVPYVRDPTDASGSTRIKISEYYTRASSEPEFVWPPLELRTGANGIPPAFQGIDWARVDYWFPAQTFNDWKANEWHHVALRWNDGENVSASTSQRNPTVRAWFDGRSVIPIHARYLGPRYQPREWNPNATPPALEDFGPPMPQFVRANARSVNLGAGSDEFEQPRDMITVGSVWRDQVRQAGVFKHDENPALPANGTIDDVRFYRAAGAENLGNQIIANRYEPSGTWEGEIDLERYFPDDGGPLTLGSFQWVAYLPTRFGARERPEGDGDIRFDVRVVNESGGTEMQFAEWAYRYDRTREPPTPTPGSGGASGLALVNPPGSANAGQPLQLPRGWRLVYRATFSPARALAPNNNGAAVASPVLDEVSAVLFLPNPRVMLKERVNY